MISAWMPIEADWREEVWVEAWDDRGGDVCVDASREGRASIVDASEGEGLRSLSSSERETNQL